MTFLFLGSDHYTQQRLENMTKLIFVFFLSQTYVVSVRGWCCVCSVVPCRTERLF